jgi:hypothetical protein
VPKAKVAGANRWFLLSGEMIYLKMGDMKPGFLPVAARAKPEQSTFFQFLIFMLRNAATGKNPAFLFPIGIQILCGLMRAI